jgi:hypothetical protein
MNWLEMQSDWERMGPVVTSRWPIVNAEELTRINGQRGELAAALGRCYGLTHEDADREICEFEKDVRFPGAVK